MSLSSSASFAAAATMAGIARRNVKRAAASRRTPRNMPIAIVEPDRDMPGISADACAHPISSASVHRRSTSVRPPLAESFRHEHRHGANRERAGGDCRRAKHILDVVAEQDRDDHDRNGADHDEARHARRGPGVEGERRRQRPDHRDDLRPEKRHDRRQRADVQGDVECETERRRYLPAEEHARQDQVRRAGNRKKLRQPLNRAEQDGGRNAHERQEGGVRRRGGGSAASPWAQPRADPSGVFCPERRSRVTPQ